LKQPVVLKVYKGDKLETVRQFAPKCDHEFVSSIICDAAIEIKTQAARMR